MRAFGQDVIAPGSTIRTYNWCWAGLEQSGYCREASQGEGKNAFRRAYWVAAKLERWLSGTFRSAVRGPVSLGHLRFYLDEFTFRFNAEGQESACAVRSARPAGSGYGPYSLKVHVTLLVRPSNCW